MRWTFWRRNRSGSEEAQKAIKEAAQAKKEADRLEQRSEEVSKAIRTHVRANSFDRLLAETYYPRRYPEQ